MKATTIDLAAEFNKAVERIPGAAQEASKFNVDLGAVMVAYGEAIAADIRENLTAGIRPDGKGPMPPRESDGAGRGTGTGTVASISVRWGQAKNRMVIAADEDVRGTLARILRGIPFRPPIISDNIKWVLSNAGGIAVGILHGSLVSRRGNKYSAKRLASWRKWQASKKGK